TCAETSLIRSRDSIKIENLFRIPFMIRKFRFRHYISERKPGVLEEYRTSKGTANLIHFFITTLDSRKNRTLFSRVRTASSYQWQRLQQKRCRSAYYQYWFQTMCSQTE